MKKILILLLLGSMSVQATTYLATLDDKHYKENIVVSPLEDQQSPSTGNSPYNSGDFIETDWISEGDKRALLDAKTGLEWLDLRETVGIGTNNIDARLATDLAGWRRATKDEVFTLMENFFGIAPATYISDYKIPAADPLENKVNELFGYMGTHLSDSYGLYTYGTYDHDGALKNAGFTNHFYSGNYYLRVNLMTSGSQYTGVGDVYGIWLVSEGGTTLSSIMNPSINTPAN